MTWVLLVLGAAGFVEVLLRLPFMGVLGKLMAAAVKARRVLLSPAISDHWKEKVLLVYSRHILLNSLQILAIILAACAPMAAALGVANIAGWLLWPLLNSLAGMTVATLAALGYLKLRRHVCG